MLFAGCAGSDLLDEAAVGRIGFETFLAKTTKAVPVSRFEDGATMSVWGYTSSLPLSTALAAAGVPGGANSISELNPATVTRRGGVWDYAPVGIWAPGLYHSFVAVSPATANAVYADGVICYTHPAQIEQQEDLMVAEASYDQAPFLSAGRKINFAFRHALAQIRFSGVVTQTAGMSDIRVVGVKMTSGEGFVGSGMLNIAAQATANVVWASLDAPSVSAYTVTPSSPVLLAVDASAAAYDPIVHHAEDVLMLIPQTPALEVSFEVSLQYREGDETKTASALFTSRALTWQSNQVYSYSFRIDMRQVLGLYLVSFDPSIGEWESVDASQP